MKQSENVVEGLIQHLREHGIITERDAVALREGFSRYSTPYFEDFLLEEGILEKEALLAVLEEYYGVPSVDVLGEIFDHDVVTLFPKGVLLRNCALPYRHDGDVLLVITNNPQNEDLQVILRDYVSYEIEFYVGIPSHIDMTIKEFYQDTLYDVDYEESIERSQKEEDQEREEDIDRYREHDTEELEGQREDEEIARLREHK